MKKRPSVIRTVGLVCLGLVIVFGINQPVTSSAAGGGYLSVRRIANFGNGIAVALYVDGAQVSMISRGRQYDGYLSPGRHVIVATPVPNVMMSQPWQRTINVAGGEHYIFTAKWQGTNLNLVPK
jgi:hypothetical protein